MQHCEKVIYYHDTDAGGVVYYANYLKYLEEARTLFLAAKDCSVPDLAKQGVLFVVKRVEVDYRAPARYADTISIQTVIEKVRNVSLLFSQTITRGSLVLVEAKTQLVCVSNEFKPQGLPDELIEKLKT